MCGIAGIYSFDETGKQKFPLINAAIQSLKKRGPDSVGSSLFENLVLGHTRLSVIDTSQAASQPFADSEGRYTIVYNGEFYNYREVRKNLEQEGVSFYTQSDTEVLLKLYIKEKERTPKLINGCFAFAVYDKVEDELFIARDRMGINPLVFYQGKEMFCFASEMKVLLAMGIPREIDENSLADYLRFNYIPGPHTIFKHVYKLTPGEYIIIKQGKFEKRRYYSIPKPSVIQKYSYDEAQKTLKQKLSEAVQKRLVADVPLGTFLSGGIDSSVIASIASQFTDKLRTFSIGFKDEPFFDETSFAELVSKKIKSDHTVFKLSNNDLLENLYSVLDYIDEPFGDSSALAVHILSMHTRKEVTVALSGDGADELFAGYNKHAAHYNAINGGFTNDVVRLMSPVWNILPKSRNSRFGNLIRQLDRFSAGIKLNGSERYLRWCSIADSKSVGRLINSEINNLAINELLISEMDFDDMNTILYHDMHIVLQNDMLHKVDMMSMANSLEVRTPFLDHEVVDFVFGLPSEFKIDGSMKKKILQDTFRNDLPEELYRRPKHGFEVPLLKWFRNELHGLIFDDLLSRNFIEDQGLFNYNEISLLKQKLLSNNPEDSVARIWGLIVFQYWWKKYMH